MIDYNNRSTRTKIEYFNSLMNSKSMQEGVDLVVAFFSIHCNNRVRFSWWNVHFELSELHIKNAHFSCFKLIFLSKKKLLIQRCILNANLHAPDSSLCSFYFRLSGCWKIKTFFCSFFCKLKIASKAKCWNVFALKIIKVATWRMHCIKRRKKKTTEMIKYCRCKKEIVCFSFILEKTCYLLFFFQQLSMDVVFFSRSHLFVFIVVILVRFCPFPQLELCLYGFCSGKCAIRTQTESDREERKKKQNIVIIIHLYRSGHLFVQKTFTFNLHVHFSGVYNSRML